jgi:hypothetical protein
LRKIDEAVSKGRGDIRELRAVAPIELEREPVDLREFCSGLVREVESLAASRRLRLDLRLEGERVKVKMYRKDVRDAASEVLYCATQHAELGSPLQIEGHVEEKEGRLDLIVRFRRSETPMTGIDTEALTIYNLEDDTLPLVRGVAKRMGGDVATHCDVEGLYNIQLKIPVEA